MMWTGAPGGRWTSTVRLGATSQIATPDKARELRMPNPKRTIALISAAAYSDAMSKVPGVELRADGPSR